MSPILPDQPNELVLTERLTPERLSEIKDLLRYESSISFHSHRAKESMLLLVAEVERLWAPGSVRSAALAVAIEAARSEYLTDATGTPEDAAYNQGVTDAIAAIGALLEGGVR